MGTLLTRALLALSVAGTAVACKSDKATGPSVPNIAGTYTYSFSNLTNGNGVVCSGTNAMPITQSGATFSGTYSGSITCSYNGGSNTGPVNGTVVNGRIAGDSVYFDLDNSNWHDFGVLQGTGMSGIVDASLDVNGTPTTLAGNFTCVKQ